MHPLLEAYAQNIFDQKSFKHPKDVKIQQLYLTVNFRYLHKFADGSQDAKIIVMACIFENAKCEII